MPKSRKTREEKAKSAYRLEGFRIKASERAEEKDKEEFGYLSSEYVVRDLTKTVVFSVIIVGLLAAAKIFLG